MNNKVKQERSIRLEILLGYIAAIIIIVGSSYFFYRNNILDFLLRLAYIMIVFSNKILGGDYIVFINRYFLKIYSDILYAYQHINDISFFKVMFIVNKSTLVLTIPSIIAFLYALKLFLNKRDSYDERVINFKNLPEIISNISPAIIPSLYYGDTKNKSYLLDNDYKGHESALNPLEYIKKHNALNNDNTINEKILIPVLYKQLGTKINKNNLYNSFSDIEKVFLVIFVTRIIKKDYKKSWEMLDSLNISCRKGKGFPDLNIVLPLFNEVINNDILIKDFLQYHFFSRTLLLELHFKAIELGKLPTSNFRWLKPMDRTLWYTLNNTGRKVAWAESSSVYSIWLWEREYKSKKININFANDNLVKDILEKSTIDAFDKFIRIYKN